MRRVAVLKSICLLVCLVIVSLLCAGSIQSAAAASSKAVTADGVDLTSVVSYFNDYVYTLSQDVVVYHWFNSNGAAPWSSMTSAKDANGINYVRNSSKGYWTTQNTDGGGNMFGFGLYAAVDPVVTQSYGGNGSTWVLVEIRLPKGFRMLNLNRDGGNSLPSEVQSQLNAASCPKYWNDRSNILNSMMAPKVGVDEKCLAAVKQVLADNLRIDGFAYQYSSTSFKECMLASETEPKTYSSYFERSVAFVITSSYRLKPDNVRIFTQNTTDETESRIRIQSAFYKAVSDMGALNSIYNPLAYSYAQNPANYPGYQNYSMQSSSWNCAVQPCKMVITLCPPATVSGPVSASVTTGCVTLDAAVMPPMPYPALISVKTVPASTNSANPIGSLLWSDLEGKSTDPALGDWLKANYFGCSEFAEYE